MGTVYDAIHGKTGRRVALKLIHERLVTSDQSRKRFEREARAAATIESLHVVQILDSGEDDASGVPFIAMEYLQGEDLRSLLKRGPLPERLAIAIAIQICSGLKKAHENEIVHRDLKPANVFVATMDDRRRMVKLLDFGIAKLVGEGTMTTDATATNATLGSPPYMSPEQLRSPRDVDEQTDVWALGVVLYEMLSGHTPTEGIEPIGARVYAICHKPAAPLRQVAPHVSSRLASIVHRALEIDKAQRFTSIDEMMSALRSLAPVTATGDILEEDLAAIGESGVRPSGVAPTGVDLVSPPRSSRRVLAMGAVGLVAMVGALWAATTWLGSGPPSAIDANAPVASAVASSSSSAPPVASSSAPPAVSADGRPVLEDRPNPRTQTVRPPPTVIKRPPDPNSVKPRPPPSRDGRDEL
jgi:serine/threonine protein kinase